jgi:ectoine hydroxylase-related dioxygenase (phytanoyl-CoA dioxygenase family)
MVRKAPHDDDYVPWHQDEGYWDPAFDQVGAGFWMPLDPATVESGCMSFIPGSHKGPVLRHGFMNGDPRITTLVLEDKIDEKKAVPHPIPIGGCSIHHSRTLHYSGPNRTGNPRRVYVNEWMLTPVKRDVPYDRPWHSERMKAKVEHFTTDGKAAWGVRQS